MPSSANLFHGIDPAIVAHESGDSPVNGITPETINPRVTAIHKETNGGFTTDDKNDNESDINCENNKNDDTSKIMNNSRNNNSLANTNEAMHNNEEVNEGGVLTNSTLASNYSPLSESVNNENFSDYYKKHEASSMTKDQAKQEVDPNTLPNETSSDANDSLLPLQHLAQASLHNRADRNDASSSNQVDHINQVTDELYLDETAESQMHQSQQIEPLQLVHQSQEQGSPNRQRQDQQRQNQHQHQAQYQRQQNHHQSQQHSRHHQQQQIQQQQIQLVQQQMQQQDQRHRQHNVDDVAAEYMQYENSASNLNDSNQVVDYANHVRPQLIVDNTNNRHGHLQNHSITSNMMRSHGSPIMISSSNMVGGARSDPNPGERRIRQLWSEQETQSLVEGCKVHGVGNWKKILIDPRCVFNNRTAVDLKDRFRTIFPEDYGRLYPNARTHKSQRSNLMLEPNQLIKVNRKERRAFTSDEDERLLKGFLKHGPSWSKIQRDVTLDLCNRRSTDLRDRFRNAFPDRYAAAGFKGRRSHANLEKKEALVANGNMLTKFAEGSSANDKRPYTQDTLSALDSTAAEAFNLADQYNQQQKPLIQSQQQIQYQPQQHPQHNHLQQHNLLQHQLQRQPKHYQEPHSNYRAQEKQLNMTHLPLNQQRKSPQLQSDRLQNQPHNQKSNPQQQYQGTSATPQSFGISNLVSGNNMNSDITEEADMSIRPDTDSHVQRAGYMQHPQGLQDQPQHQQQQLHQQQIQKQQHQQQHQQLYYQEQSANAAMYYSHLYPSGTQTS